MNKRVVRIVAIFALICFTVLTLTSCGAKGSGVSTAYAYDKKNNADAYDDQVDWAEIRIAQEIISISKNKIEGKTELTDDDKAELTALTELEKSVKEMVLSANKTKDYTDTVKKVNELAQNINTEYEANKNENTVNPIVSAIINNIILSNKNGGENAPTQYVDYLNISGKDTLEKAEENFKVEGIKKDIEVYVKILENATSFEMLSIGVATDGELKRDLTEEEQLKTNERVFLVKVFEKKGGCLSATSTLSANATKLINEYNTISNKINVNEDAGQINIYRTLVAFMAKVEVRQLEQEPIVFQLRVNKGFGTFVSDFFGNFFDNFLVYPVGIILWFTSSLFGGWYIIGLFITTILIRTAGWPIYAKTNDMSLKMQVIQPEMQKLEEKYKNRQDPDSQRMKQAELAQIYKKNKIGLGGCFLPFLQFPIFMAVYGAVRRFPYTDWAQTTLFGGQMKSSLFGLSFDLFEDYANGETLQFIGIIVLVILVCGTQFLSQFLSERRQKQNHERSQEDIPAYRRQAYKQNNNQGQNTMKYVMYMMIFMMGTFVFTSKAGLGVYWLIGNLYSILQMFINNELGQKKLKKMRENANQYR